MKKVQEFSVKVPWGKVALTSWGHHNNPPILMLHGYMDTAATFIPMVNLLPDSYYYVAFDIPGAVYFSVVQLEPRLCIIRHGKSDPFPSKLIVSQVHVVEVLKKIVEKMKWKHFYFLAHSMGCVIGLFYNHIFPGKMKKMILLDGGPPISMYYYVNEKLPYWFMFFYKEYYDNYAKWNSGKARLYTYDQAISLLVRNRSLTEEQSEILLSRSLINMGIDSYKLSWDPRMKKISTIPISEETLYTILTLNSTPTLSIEASESKDETPAKKFAENLMHKADETLTSFYRVTVKGGHDVHITNPELIVPHIVDFLYKERSKTYCKL